MYENLVEKLFIDNTLTNVSEEDAADQVDKSTPEMDEHDKVYEMVEYIQENLVAAYTKMPSILEECYEYAFGQDALSYFLDHVDELDEASVKDLYDQIKETLQESKKPTESKNIRKTFESRRKEKTSK